MCKAVLLLSVLVAILIAESSCQRVRIIRPVYRRPVKRIIIIRRGREAPNEPLWLNQGDIPRAPATGDHPFLPKYIDDIKLDPERRYARSLDSYSHKHGGGRSAREAPNEPLWLNQGDIPRAPATGDHPFLPNYIDDIKLDPERRYTRSLDSPTRGGSLSGFGSGKPRGTTHPGQNRRHAREIRLPFDPLPRPQKPFDPFNPFPRPGPRPFYPIYARTVRDIHVDDDEDLIQESF